MSRRTPQTAIAVAVYLAIGWLGTFVSAQEPVSARGPVVLAPLSNFIDVLVVDREVLAFDAIGSKNFRARLAPDEEAIWSDAQGLVGIVVTNLRALAATPAASQWQEVRWRRSEKATESGTLSDRLILLTTPVRVLAFDSAARSWMESSIGPGERVTSLRVGENNGVVVTNRRALAIAPDARGFLDTHLRVHEDIERVSAEDNLATVTTSQRVLVFRSRAGSWSEINRPIQR